MQVTNEGYVLSRNIVKVNIKKNRFLKFIKSHKISIIVSIILIQQKYGIKPSWYFNK